MSAPVEEVVRESEAADEKGGFRPYVPASVKGMPELTWSALALGTFLGLVFSVSSLYLVLKVGMTVSATIPVAVLAITVFRGLSKLLGSRPATILENNIVQTAGSAGESIAFGVGVTMPALLMLGFGMEPTRVLVVSVLGGLLGILAMIPLRRAFIVKMHGRPGEPGKLLYPEGVAAAQVLISGDKGGTTGSTVFFGFGVAFVHKLLTLGFNLLKETVSVPITVINRAAVFAADMASELLGVGYIIGIRTASIMMAGAVLGYLVIIPVIYFIGQHAPEAIPPSTEKRIADMSISEIRNNYLLYIGAGCVAAAGIMSMGRTLPLIVRSISAGVATMRNNAGSVTEVKRTDRDMSLRVVFFGCLGLLALLTLFLMTEVSWYSAILGALLVVLFGFLFVTVSARLTGEIGSSSNPISGMTVATLMLTCLIFLALGMTSPRDRLLALSVAAVVCIAASNGGTTAQSLKTGFLVGGTPRAMQIAILVGALVSALVIGVVLIWFNDSATVYSTDSAYLPKTATGEVVALSPEQMARLPERTTYEGKEYLIWDTRQEFFTKEKGDPPHLLKMPEGTAPTGRFLVDPETGKVAYLVDPTIGGVIKTVDGRELTRFDAPKTQVMRIIIDGVLTQKLNWSLVLIGAMIAITLELCGVSSLAFAVGVYVPIQFSVPIFLGGLVRWGIDSWQARRSQAEIAAAGDDPEARARAEIEAIRRSETSPGVLLASGYIAGGSLAGVAIAFLSFPFLKPIQTAIDMSAATKDLAGWVADILAIAMFAVLIVIAVIVGTGYLFKQVEPNSVSAANSGTNGENGPPPAA